MGGLLIMLLAFASGIGLIGHSAMSSRRSRPTQRQHEESRSAVHLDDQRELVEAIATFTEQLRDTIGASAGLEQAISVTLETCPEVIEPAVRRLVANMRYGGIQDALRDFAHELGHPTSDFVVAALLAAVQHRTRDLAGLLTQLSVSARDECDLYLRVWVSRARTRSAVRIVIGSLATFVSALVLFDPGSLTAFLTRGGVVALAVVCGGFCGGLWMLDRLARFVPPVRLLRVGEA